MIEIVLLSLSTSPFQRTLTPAAQEKRRRNSSVPIPVFIFLQSQNCNKISSENFQTTKMQWVRAENCTLICPNYTNCMRPVEYTEPIICVHEKWDFPKDLERAPDLFSCEQPVLIILCFLILLTVQVKLYTKLF